MKSIYSNVFQDKILWFLGACIAAHLSYPQLSHGHCWQLFKNSNVKVEWDEKDRTFKIDGVRTTTLSRELMRHKDMGSFFLSMYQVTPYIVQDQVTSYIAKHQALLWIELSYGRSERVFHFSAFEIGTRIIRVFSVSDKRTLLLTNKGILDLSVSGSANGPASLAARATDWLSVVERFQWPEGMRIREDFSSKHIEYEYVHDNFVFVTIAPTKTGSSQPGLLEEVRLAFRLPWNSTEEIVAGLSVDSSYEKLDSRQLPIFQ